MENIGAVKLVNVISILFYFICINFIDIFKNLHRNIYSYRRVKQGIFQSRRIFQELGHFDKQSSTTQKRKAQRGKIFGVFPWKLKNCACLILHLLAEWTIIFVRGRNFCIMLTLTKFAKQLNLQKCISKICSP